MMGPFFSRFVDLQPPSSDFRQDVLTGLSETQKNTPPKYFYNSEGSRIFEQICDLPSYYLTRTEYEILSTYASELRKILPTNATVVEFGSGNYKKIELLISAVGTVREYVAVDISRNYLVENAEAYARQNPNLAVTAICADFTHTIDLENILGVGPRIGFFPGSTIGNLTPSAAIAFLRNVATGLGPGAFFVIGVDLQKDRKVLISAYDDVEGITAKFNLNLLVRINEQLEGNFDIKQFRHRAIYKLNPTRIEMHLESRRAQKVRISDRIFHFLKGETIHTENAHKYTIEGFQNLASSAGFSVCTVFVDPGQLFSLHVLKVPN